MNTPEALPQVNPLAYLDSTLHPILPKEELFKTVCDISSTYANMTRAERLTATSTDEERVVIESLLRYVDAHIPNNPGFSRASKHNPMARLCLATSFSVLDREFADIDVDDLRQEARITTMLQLRRFDPERSSSPLTFIGPNIASSLTIQGGRALSYGFGNSSHERRTVINGYKPTPISATRKNVFSHPTEAGWSDELFEIESHPDFIKTEPLLARRDIDELEEFPQSFGGPYVPANDVADENNPFAEVEATQDLQRILNLIEANVKLSENDKKLLIMRYQDQLTLSQTGELFGISHQAARERSKRIINKIRQVPELMSALVELAQ